MKGTHFTAGWYQLGEGHGPVLLGAGKRPDPVIAAVPVDDPREGGPWQEVHELGELPVFMSISSGKLRKVLHQFKSTPRIFASHPAAILAFKAKTVQLTGQQ